MNTIDGQSGLAARPEERNVLGGVQPQRRAQTDSDISRLCMSWSYHDVECLRVAFSWAANCCMDASAFVEPKPPTQVNLAFCYAGVSLEICCV